MLGEKMTPLLYFSLRRNSPTDVNLISLSINPNQLCSLKASSVDDKMDDGIELRACFDPLIKQSFVSLAPTPAFMSDLTTFGKAMSKFCQGLSPIATPEGKRDPQRM